MIPESFDYHRPSSVDEAIGLLASRGNLIKRPFVLSDDVALVGFRESEWEEALG